MHVCHDYAWVKSAKSGSSGVAFSETSYACQDFQLENDKNKNAISALQIRGRSAYVKWLFDFCGQMRFAHKNAAVR